MRFVLLTFISFAMISNVASSKREKLFLDLLQRGKSFFSRSFRQFEEPEALNMIFPEHRHRAQYHDVELLKDHSMPEAKSQHYPSDSDQEHPKKHEVAEKDKSAGGYILYRTDIIENDNLDLYGLIGGISFASLLATTLFVLGRNRRNTGGSFGKSLDEILKYRERENVSPRRFNSMPYKF